MTEADDIEQRIPETTRGLLQALEWFPELESTNTWLKQQIAAPAGRFRVVITAHQTAGRGRNEKVWLAPPSSGVCLSISYTFARMPRDLPALTLAVGVGLTEMLEGAGARELMLKWPNDLIARGGKVGGVLTETQSAGGDRTVVIGVGINVDLPDSMRYAAPTSWASKISDLAGCMDEVPHRAELTAAVVTALVKTIRRFESEGLSAFRASWQAHDWLLGKTVTVQQAGGELTGISDGIDEDGALLLKTEAGTERVLSGSVRLAPYTEIIA